MPIKIGLVEDNPALRKRFLDNFQYFDNMELVMVAASGEEALRKLDGMEKGSLPEIILMDIELPGISGIETTKRIKASYGEQIDIMMLTIFEHTDKIIKSVNAGAVGYLLKDETPQALVTAIAELREGGAPMSRKIARKVITQLGQGSGEDKASKRAQKIAEYGLSEKEIQVIEQLVEGKNYTEIAELMFISPHTVKTHIKNIYRKMHVHTRASVVKSAMDDHIV